MSLNLRDLDVDIDDVKKEFSTRKQSNEIGGTLYA